MIGYIIWSIVIIALICLNFALCLWILDSLDMIVLATVVTIVSGGAWLGLAIWKTSQPDTPPTGTVQWEGGRGEDTVCWYTAKDNPDQVIMAGKTPVIIPDDGVTLWTTCSVDGKNIPEGAR